MKNLHTQHSFTKECKITTFLNTLMIPYTAIVLFPPIIAIVHDAPDTAHVHHSDAPNAQIPATITYPARAPKYAPFPPSFVSSYLALS